MRRVANTTRATNRPRAAPPPHLAGDVDGVVGGAPEARRAQAVAVEPRADLGAVAEHEQRGAVPALLQALVKLVKVDDLRAGTRTRAF